MSAASTKLVLPGELVGELRLALVAELRVLGKSIAEHVPSVPFTFASIEDADLSGRLYSRLRLLEIIGWSGQPLPEGSLTLVGGRCCDLPVEILGEYRDGEAERLSSGEIPPSEQEDLERRVKLLNAFLTDYLLRPRTRQRASRARRVAGWLRRLTSPCAQRDQAHRTHTRGHRTSARQSDRAAGQSELARVIPEKARDMSVDAAHDLHLDAEVAGPGKGRSVGPGSLIWTYLGDWRLFLFIGRTGAIQNMHPGVSAVLEAKSVVFKNPWARVMGSIPTILGTVYDAPEQQTPKRVSGFHDGLSAIDSQARHWHTLDPEVFYWTHATFVELIVAINEFFGTPQTATEKDQLIAESVLWWQPYGLSERPVLRDWASFHAYWIRNLNEVLERTPTAEFTLRSPRAKVPAPPHVPRLLWLIIRYPVMVAYLRLSIALMPPEVRRVLGVRSSTAEQHLLRTFGWVVRHGWPPLPERWRYHPRARAGISRERKHSTSHRDSRKVALRW
ncbi:MAG TPA: oxygenase MpaB family protein [Solirubrobacteraceae bacterium]|nr:oxygenase MpaB family protein [Solirubrobacteraceae bacterium]